MHIEDYRPRLLALEQELAKRIGAEVDTAQAADDGQPDDAGDLGNVDLVTEESFTLAQADSEILGQVRDALARIDAGTYGLCVIDDEPIEPKRLEATPWTPYCLRHQAELEARDGIRTPTL